VRRFALEATKEETKDEDGSDLSDFENNDMDDDEEEFFR
jgi:hypothetical protein